MALVEWAKLEPPLQILNFALRFSVAPSAAFRKEEPRGVWEAVLASFVILSFRDVVAVGHIRLGSAEEMLYVGGGRHTTLSDTLNFPQRLLRYILELELTSAFNNLHPASKK